MSFCSIQFMVFLPAVLALYWLASRHRRLRLSILLVASYGFYASWSPHYCLLILGSTILDYVLALRMHRCDGRPMRTAYLVASLAGNLGVLFLFKYFNLFAHTIDALAGRAIFSTLDWLLPVGISFYTFQTLSYTIDVYRRKLEPTRSLLEFALFVSFFPQLVAGPIVRASHFLPQLKSRPVFNDDDARSGLGRILMGIAKKALIADTLGRVLVDPVFADPSAYRSGALLLATYGFTFQIYFDFSGYSDVAIGAARMLGFKLDENFRRPFLATSIGDFWKRWHISLSSWLRDYLYVPLGGNRISPSRTALNLVIVMFLAGLWHGAGWTFVAFGLLNGLFLAAGRTFRAATSIDPEAAGQGSAVRCLRVLLTFQLFTISLLPFRSDSFAHAWQMGAGIFEWSTIGLSISPAALCALAVAAIAAWSPSPAGLRPDVLFARCGVWIRSGLCVLLLAAVNVVGPQAAPFIYFQF